MSISLKQIEEFLTAVDRQFPIPLSQKTDLGVFALKLLHCSKYKTIINPNGRIISAVFGYIHNTKNNIGYISVVATLPEYKGRGYATSLILDFLEDANKQGLRAVHLYTHAQNAIAIRMYQSIGFRVWDVIDEPRPGDVHLVYMFNHV